MVPCRLANASRCPLNITKAVDRAPHTTDCSDCKKHERKDEEAFCEVEWNEFFILQQGKDVAQSGYGERQNKLQGETQLVEGESLPSDESVFINQLISATCGSVRFGVCHLISHLHTGNTHTPRRSVLPAAYLLLSLTSFLRIIAVPVAKLGGAGLGVARGTLYVIERCAVLQRRRDEDRAHRMRRITPCVPNCGGVFAQYPVDGGGGHVAAESLILAIVT
jgi:hypothetical protein